MSNNNGLAKGQALGGDTLKQPIEKSEENIQKNCTATVLRYSASLSGAI